MSISSTTSRNDYLGNGSVDTYSYNFKIFASTDLLVTVRSTDDVETTLTLNTHYTVTGVGNQAGGAVALVDGSYDWIDADGDLETDWRLTIRRVRPITQITDIRNQGSFLPETHEDAFDHGIMVAQQQQDSIDRSLKLPETVSADGFDATLPADIADEPGGVICVNADGDGFDVLPPEIAGTLDGVVVGDLTLTSNGGSIVLKSPDGSKSIRLGLNNDGNFGEI